MYSKSNANATTTVLSYDEVGRPASETKEIDDITIQYDYTYDLAGRQISKEVYQDNVLFKTLHYAFYPGTSLLEAVRDGNNNAYALINTYSPQGKIEDMKYSTSTDMFYSYDYCTGRLLTIYSQNLS